MTGVQGDEACRASNYHLFNSPSEIAPLPSLFSEGDMAFLRIFAGVLLTILILICQASNYHLFNSPSERASLTSLFFQKVTWHFWELLKIFIRIFLPNPPFAKFCFFGMGTTKRANHQKMYHLFNSPQESTSTSYLFFSEGDMVFLREKKCSGTFRNIEFICFLFLLWEPRSPYWYVALGSGMHWVGKANKGQL